MNGSCAGGTGAFIDQMATLLNISLEEMDSLSEHYEKIYTIASRCGVFAKSDIQPLLNQGARKSDLSASIFAAVANQTIAGLAQGRPITGNILYLGGPLTFLKGLRRAFDTALKTTGLCPENSLYYVALGAAYSSEIEIDLDTAMKNIAQYGLTGNFRSIDPLSLKTRQSMTPLLSATAKAKFRLVICLLIMARFIGRRFWFYYY
jgi:activator of 2-hydroxyglutaryl-CoA dehydratase